MASGSRQGPDYTRVNLLEVEDLAPRFGYGELLAARFPGGALEARDTGLSLQHLRPGCKQPYGHRHERAEEIYVVLEGSGRVCLDGEVVELQRFDALRVAPQVARRFEAGPEGMTLLAFGPRCQGDGEMLPEFWS